MDIRQHNKLAWDRMVDAQDRWTRPVSSEEIARARNGDWRLPLTPSKAFPKSWFPPVNGCRILCLAGGGGQQGSILAAAGANVTVFDNSPKQLAQDRFVAKRDGLSLETIEGDMRVLSAFTDQSFDFILHPCSNCFVDDVRSVWREAYRVLRVGGTMIAGFVNPVTFQFDPEREKEGVFQVKFPAPYSDLASITAAERERLYPDEPLHFAHSLEDQIGGQIDAGFHIIGFYEDTWGGDQPIDRYMPAFLATRALKPRM